MSEHLKPNIPSSHYCYTRYKCRCVDCKAAHSAYMKDWRQRKSQRDYYRLGR